ncbi:MFS transporter [candidate division KSB1 bacterium]|nr:MFS transporter [candidate division KSB1 bacterium]
MQKLSIREKVGYSIGEIASNIIWMTVMFFLPIFYTDTFGIPAAVVGTMFIVVRLFDAINDPIMGMIADRTTTRWGKYRPYILWMALPYGIGGILMFLTPDLHLTGKIIYAYITYNLMMIIYTMIMIPFSALSGVMTSDYLDRTSLNSYRFVGAFVGGLFIQGLALLLVNYLGQDNQSVISAKIENQQIVVQEAGTGTAKLRLTANDSGGARIEHDFLIKICRPGENPPQVIKPVADLILDQGFSTYQIDLDSVFQDRDKDNLKYSIEVKPSNILQTELSDQKLILKEKGIGTAAVQLMVDDGNGGVANDDFLIRIRKKGNHAPEMTQQVSDLNFPLNFEPNRFYLARTFGLFPKEEVDIGTIFKDPDGDPLYLSVSSSKTTVVAATISESRLILKKKSPGITTITLTADDAQGGVTAFSFDVSIQTTGNTPPVLNQPINNVMLQTGFGKHLIDISEVFKDSESTPLKFTLKVNNDAKGYRLTMSIFAIFCIVFFLITFFSTRERVKPVATAKSRLIDDLKDLTKNRPWLVLFSVSLLTLIYVAIRSAVIAYYFQYYVGDSTLTAAFLVSGSIIIIISLGITRWLTKIFDKRLLYVICMIVVGISLSLFHFVGPEDIILMFILQAIQSFASGPTMPLLWSMLADSADYSEWKTGRKAMGLAYSASTFAQKAGIAFGGALALWILAYFGYQPNVQQSAQSLHGMKLMIGIYPAIGAFLCAILISFYTLDSTKMEKIEAELKARREN